MEWYGILATVLGAVGGIGGIGGLISIYNAKSNKDKIDIGNMQEMLNEAHEMYNAVKADKDAYRQELADYKEDTAKYISEFKERFFHIEERLKKTEHIVSLAYRCPFPPKLKECPVIKDYEKLHNVDFVEECNTSNK